MYGLRENELCIINKEQLFYLKHDLRSFSFELVKIMSSKIFKIKKTGLVMGHHIIEPNSECLIMTTSQF